MSVIFENYNSGYKVVSIALDEKTKLDLTNDELDFLYINNNEIILFPDNVVLISNQGIDSVVLHNYDVFEIYVDGSLHKAFDMCNNDNYFFVTGRCNSNCIMCPSSEYSRRYGRDSDVNNLIEIAKHIPTSVNHLTITGGEPFLVGDKIFDFILYLKEKFEHTDFLILTNGRIFSVERYAERLKDVMPFSCTVAIPVHSSSAKEHDSITQTNNSYIQTIAGVKRLLSLGIKVELRIVVSKLNVDSFYNTAKLITDELSNVAYVSVIAMEMTGSAAVNRSIVWIQYKEAFEKISNGVVHLIENGVDVKLYNFPLCTVRKDFWTLCEKSISSNKVRFAEVCKNCSVKNACGGVFSGTLSLVGDELEAVE